MAIQKRSSTVAKPSKKTEIFRKKQCDFLSDELQKAAKILSKTRSSILTNYRFRSKRKSFRRERFDLRFRSLFAALNDQQRIEKFQFAKRLLKGEMNATEFANFDGNDWGTEPSQKKWKRR
jgi:hypothetical protein